MLDKPRPEYGERYEQTYEGAAQKPREPSVRSGASAARGFDTTHHKTASHSTAAEIELKFPNALQKQTGIIIAGGAGQKIKSTATIFGQAAMLSGLEATQKDDDPITVMTGHSVAEIIVSPERIDYTAIDVPDYLVLLSEEGLAQKKPLLPPFARL